MKKLYVQPSTENVVLNIREQLTVGELANPSNPHHYTEGKENTIIFEDFMEEEPDTTSFWSNDPWKIQYSLWEDE